MPQKENATGVEMRILVVLPVDQSKLEQQGKELVLLHGQGLGTEAQSATVSPAPATAKLALSVGQLLVEEPLQSTTNPPGQRRLDMDMRVVHRPDTELVLARLPL